MGKIILVTGDRNWTNDARIYQVLDHLDDKKGIRRLVNGYAKGADMLCDTWAVDNGAFICKADEAPKNSLTLKRYVPMWHLGPVAGRLRNQEMLDNERIELCVGFNNDIKSSKGTKDMLRRTLRDDIPSFLFTESEFFNSNELFSMIGKYIDYDGKDVVWPDGTYTGYKT